jgi:hypothetical protein
LTNLIKALIAPGEGDRYKKLALACNEDPRFHTLDVSSEIPVDVQFQTPRPDIRTANAKDLVAYIKSPIPAAFNVELKTCADYIQSALGKDGHLFLQHLSMRESGHPGMILVLGDDVDVFAAIKASLVTRYHGQELGFQIANYESRLQDFEAQSFALGIPVMRWKARPFSRLLSTAAKVLGEATLMDYRPRPADGERELCAASCLHRGIGPELMKVLLDEYQLAFVPRGDYAVPVEELPGWGPKRCAQVNPMIRMTYGRHA